MSKIAPEPVAGQYRQSTDRPTKLYEVDLGDGRVVLMTDSGRRTKKAAEDTQQRLRTMLVQRRSGKKTRTISG